MTLTVEHLNHPGLADRFWAKVEKTDSWQIRTSSGPILVPAYYVGTARRVPRLALEQALTTLAAT